MMVVVLNGLAMLLILFVAWWFWWPRQHRSVPTRTGVIDIKVIDGVYVPALVKVAVGKSVLLRFTRYDHTPCASVVVFSEFDLSAALPLEKPVEIKLIPQKTGEFSFSCQMAMYRGTLLVV